MIKENLLRIKSSLPEHVTLVAVSKTKPNASIMEAYEAGQRVFGENKVQEMTTKYEELPKDIHWHLLGHLQTKPNASIMEAYEAGQRVFGENKVQEMTTKYEELPKDIHWHLLGHLQTNKVKYIAPFVDLIHSGDSIKLLAEIDRQGKKADRIINCLIQVHIAVEETKFGMSYEEAEDFFSTKKFSMFSNVKVRGLMGMASNVEDEKMIRNEFKGLKSFYDRVSDQWHPLDILSMGMSHDHTIAIEEGSTMIRVGSAIFGER